MRAGKGDSFSVRGCDSFSFRGSDSFAYRGCDSFSSRGMVTSRGCDSFASRGIRVNHSRVVLNTKLQTCPGVRADLNVPLYLLGATAPAMNYGKCPPSRRTPMDGTSGECGPSSIFRSAISNWGYLGPVGGGAYGTGSAGGVDVVDTRGRPSVFTVLRSVVHFQPQTVHENLRGHIRIPPCLVMF